MISILTNPAFVSGFVPLLVSLVIAGVGIRITYPTSGVVFGISFYTSVHLTTGLQFLPLTNIRKILIIGLAAIVLGAAMDTINKRTVYTTFIIFILASIAAAWVVWPVVSRVENTAFWSMFLPSLLYVGWVTIWNEQLNLQPQRATMATLAMGIGLGVCALLGATALIGQLSIAMAATAMAYLILLLLKKNVQLGSQFTLPIGVLAGLLGISAVDYARLPWYCLIPLAGIPLLVRLPIRATTHSVFGKFGWLAVFAIPLPLIAIIVAWISTQSSDVIF